MNHCQNCGEPLSENSELDDCTTCRRSFYYWKRRSPRQRMQRREKLSLFATRLLNWFPREVKKK